MPDHGTLSFRLRSIRHVALDMDGTIYCGSRLFDEVIPFLARLRELGLEFTFLTNNSSKSTEEYLARLQGMGIEVTVRELLISTHVAVEVLRSRYPAATRVFALGTAGFHQELRAAGFHVLGRKAMERPDAVVAGFDTGMNYQDFCKAAYWVKQGLPYLATHPDTVCPTDEETVLVDCGSLCAAIEKATGRAPDVVAGKPDRLMLDILCQRLGLTCAQVAMVGDRLYTDVRMAQNAGALGVLTLTGETRLDDLPDSAIKPDLVIGHLGELASRLISVRTAIEAGTSAAPV